MVGKDMVKTRRLTGHGLLTRDGAVVATVRYVLTARAGRPGRWIGTVESTTPLAGSYTLGMERGTAIACVLTARRAGVYRLE